METVDTSLPHEVHSDGKNGLHQSYVPVYGPQDWLLRHPCTPTDTGRTSFVLRINYHQGTHAYQRVTGFIRVPWHTVYSNTQCDK